MSYSPTSALDCSSFYGSNNASTWTSRGPGTLSNPYDLINYCVFSDHYLKTQNKKKLNWRHGTDGRVCSSSVIKPTSSGFAEDQLDWVKLPAK